MGEVHWREVLDVDALRAHLHQDLNVERGDEHLYAHLQSTLPSRILVDLLRPAVTLARMHERRFIHERDFVVARKLSTFPVRGTRSTHRFFHTEAFRQMVNDHLILLCAYVDRYTDGDGETEVLRISNENVESLRQQMDTTVCLFLQRLAEKSTRRLVTTKVFDAVLAEWMHDQDYVTREDPYVPLSDF